MSLRSPLGRAKGLGSAHEGTGHWWTQRITSIALVPLTLWFVASVIAMAGADYFAMQEWLRSPVVAGILILFLVAGFYHGALGMQVVIEDYVHHEGAKIAALMIVNGLSLVLGLAGVLAILSVLFKA